MTMPCSGSYVWKLVTACSFVAALAACGGSQAAPRGESASTMPSPEEYAEKPISAAAGAEYFQQTGSGDPYATGIAYPILLAFMDAYPNELGRDWNEFAETFGFYPDPTKKGDPHAVPVGFHVTVDPNTAVPWVVGNCQLCHAERLRLETGDVIVPGLGNKRVRVHAYADALARIGLDPHLDIENITERATRQAAAWGITWPANMRRPIVAATVASFVAGSKRRAPALQRLAPALPGRIATIESFALVMNDTRTSPIATPSTIGWTKVPDVRSFPFRDTFSYDASGYGSAAALVLDADFIFGARPAWYATHPYIATSTLMYLRSFGRALPFPKPLDAALAAKGKAIFESRCARCHGFYVDHGDEMRVSYRERVVPLAVVGTDPARANAVTPSFVDAANAKGLARGYARVRNTGGYVPPVLLDVWARGLYGHAGQWPSLEVMATPPGERPRVFIVDTDGPYDLERIGVHYEAVRGDETRTLKKSEYLYDGAKGGLSVDGHRFLSDLAAPDRKAVIEYLKGLSSR